MKQIRLNRFVRRMVRPFDILLFRLCSAFSLYIARRRCFLPKEIGVCRARKTRYYFNQETGSCEEFIYGGCRGNRNNFYSLERCRRACE